jgi:hypothetical protein
MNFRRKAREAKFTSRRTLNRCALLMLNPVNLSFLMKKMLTRSSGSRLLSS